MLSKVSEQRIEVIFPWHKKKTILAAVRRNILTKRWLITYIGWRILMKQ